MNTSFARHRTTGIAVCLLIAMVLSLPPATAAEDDFSVGVRAVAQFGNGKPGNDSLGGEVYVRRVRTEKMAFDVYYGMRRLDFELPAERIFGLTTRDLDAAGNEVDIDPIADFHVLGARAEWSWRPFPSERLSLFSSAGVGVAYFSYTSVNGDLANGGVYRVQDGSGWEIVPSAAAGVRYDLTERFRVELGLQDDYHFSKIDVSATTTVNGQDERLAREVGNYNELGVFLGLQYRW